MSNQVDIATPLGPMPSHLFVPEAGRGAGIVLVHEIFGVSNYVLQRAEDLRALGYAVLVPNVYWRIGGEAVPDEAPDLLERGMALMQRVDWAGAVDDVRAAVRQLRDEDVSTGRVALFGFCFGGGLAYAAASGATGAEAPDALVSYYGSALPMLVDSSPVVTAPSLHHFGDADTYIAPEVVAHIREVVTSVPGVQLRMYPGAGHAFDNPIPMFHHAQASKDAWQATEQWLADNYPASNYPATGA